MSLARKTIWADVETRRRTQADRVNVTPANLYSDISLATDIKASFELESGKPAPYLVGGLFEDAVIQDFAGAYGVMAWILSAATRRSREPRWVFWGNPAFSYSDAMACGTSYGPSSTKPTFWTILRRVFGSC